MGFQRQTKTAAATMMTRPVILVLDHVVMLWSKGLVGSKDIRSTRFQVVS